MIILKLIVFILSNLGLFLFVHHALKFKLETSGMMAVLIFSSILYIASILNVLLLITHMIYGAGIISFCYFVIKKRWRPLFNRSYHSLILILFSFILISVLFNSKLVHYDNFSHWARIVKFLFLEGRLPLEADKIIEFTAYPVGSAIPLFYSAYYLKYNETILLITQFVIIVSAFSAMTIMTRDKKRVLTQSFFYMFLVFSLIASRSIGLSVLLVDYLMVVLAVGALVSLVHYRHQFKQMSLIMFFSIFYIITLKNSAIFFVIPIFFLYLYFVFRYHKKITIRISGTLLAISSFSSTVMWSLHFNSNFSVVSKHGVSIDSYKSIFAEKSVDTIKSIINLFFSTSFDLNTSASKGILVSFLSLLLLILSFEYIRKTTKLYQYFVYLWIYVGTYYLGILAMFIFSMPTDEALVLAGYDRYAASMAVYIILIVGVLIMYYGDMLYSEPDVRLRNFKSYYSVNSKFIYQLASLVTVFLVYLLFSSERRIVELENIDYDRSIPYAVLKQTGDRLVANDDLFLIVSSDDQGQISSYYIQNVAKHYLWSPYVDAYDRYYEFSKDEFLDLFKKYDSIVVVENNISFREMFYDAFGYVLEEGVYATQDILNSN